MVGLLRRQLGRLVGIEDEVAIKGIRAPMLCLAPLSSSLLVIVSGFPSLQLLCHGWVTVADPGHLLFFDRYNE